ncbi:alkaline phosphatase [Nocardioides sp.]|uniref:alkaline phosphatase n=1 Tax=Nocardioides sp. TaxID=35761 RepID=UPI002B277D2A|nr:alkaline phosphatase [Nocardioides sp.]
MSLSTPTRRRVTVASAAAIALASSAGLVGAVAVVGLATATPDAASRLAGDRTASLDSAIVGGQAHNVILLIGDGMGDSEITIARNYAEGAAGRFAGIDALPLTGQLTTYSLDRATGLPDYVPDSAATATAWATGVKSFDGAIGVDVNGKSRRTLLELAKREGLKTGNVSTADIQDATPAAQVAHITERGCKGPERTTAWCPDEALENGGPGSISEQLLVTRPDVSLGGGAKYFDEEVTAGVHEGRSVLEQADALGFEVVSTRAELRAVSAADQKTPLLGLFAESNLAVRYVGPEATLDGTQRPARECETNPGRPATQPTLADMTSKAIDLLENPDGFFLQVEGASIDKQDHAANACGQIGETVDLDEAVRVALDFAEADGNTSVFVTADHAHSAQLVEVGSVTPGVGVTLLTADGAPMAITYGTSVPGDSQQHTGSQVRIAGYGPQAAGIVGLTDQTDLHATIARALGLVRDPATSSANAAVTVRPGKPRAGGKVRTALSRFKGDRTATVTLKGRGMKVTENLSLGSGRASFTARPKKAGRYVVRAVGDQTGAKVVKTFKVR